jgi:hypothetical protein
MTGTLAVHPFSFDKYIIAENDLMVKRKIEKETVDD